MLAIEPLFDEESFKVTCRTKARGRAKVDSISGRICPRRPGRRLVIKWSFVT
jgi:hypothetical protein